jgi:biotin synthase
MSLLQGARRSDRARELFAAASKVRDRRLGKELTLTAHLHMVTPCELTPACRYCSISSSIPSVQDERSELSERALVRGVRYATDRGVRSIVLVGGTVPEGADTSVRKTVRMVRRVSDVELALDVGPSLSPETVEWLKGEGVRTIYCSIETANPKVFRRAKPGDDRDARIEFSAMLERHGMTLGNVVMNGLGSAEDLLRSVLYLRRFRRLGYLHISTFQPVRGTPWARRRPASVPTSLRALAIARLAFPAAQLGLAEVEVEDPGSAARVASQIRAGGGNTFAGILIYRGRRVDHVEQILREASGAGFVVRAGAVL